MDQNQFDYTQEPEQKISPFADSPYVAAAPENVPVKPVKKKKKSGLHIVNAILIVVLIVACCGVTAAGMSLYWQHKIDLMNTAVDNRLEAFQDKMDSFTPGSNIQTPVVGMTPAQVYSQNVNAVVSVSTQNSVGSGFFVSKDGYVVTNHHVISGATQVSVTTAAGKAYSAKIVGSESSNDVALLKVDGEEFPCVKVGSSTTLAVGDQVVAIGNPLGTLTATLTSGYISAKDRTVTTDGTAMNMLQTDAAINSGNSGGPLFNMKGEVVGITTAKYSGSSNSGASIEGIGFAIPFDDVAGILTDLGKFGHVTGAYMGVTVRDVEQVVQDYGFPAGAYIESIESGSAAQKAGLQMKDIVVNVGGYEVNSVSQLTIVLRKFKAGDTTTMTVFRAGKNLNMEITFGEKPAQNQSQQSNTQQQTPESEDSFGEQYPGYNFPFWPFG